MKLTPVQWVASLVGTLLIAVASWWWATHMEYRTHAQVSVSSAAAEDPMYAAGRFLQQAGYHTDSKVDLAAALSDPHDAGLIIVDSRSGVLTATQGKTLLQWVAAGGVLVIDALESTSKLRDTDPITQVTQIDKEYFLNHTTASGNNSYHVTPPDAPYPLRLSRTFFFLHHIGGEDSGDDDTALDQEWSDDDNTQLRVLRYGKGHLVITDPARFTNGSLRLFDHGELLLAIAHLARPGRHVSFVLNVVAAPWYALLWQHAAEGLCATATTLFLLLWAAALRFGPLLPDATRDRRALTEHIDASARWLWQRPVGRHLLISAVRTAVRAQLGRRYPELLRLGPAELAHRLAARTKLPEAQVNHALNQPVPARPIDFVRQLQTLQQLRKYHER